MNQKTTPHWLLPLNLSRLQCPSSWENCPSLLLSQTNHSIWSHALIMSHSAHYPMICLSFCTSAWGLSCIIFNILLRYYMGFPGGSVVKNTPANAGDATSIPGLGRSSGEGNGNPLQYSCWGIPWSEGPGGLRYLADHKRVTQDLVTQQDTILNVLF